LMGVGGFFARRHETEKTKQAPKSPQENPAISASKSPPAAPTVSAAPVSREAEATSPVAAPL